MHSVIDEIILPPPPSALPVVDLRAVRLRAMLARQVIAGKAITEEQQELLESLS